MVVGEPGSGEQDRSKILEQTQQESTHIDSGQKTLQRQLLPEPGEAVCSESLGLDYTREHKDSALSGCGPEGGSEGLVATRILGQTQPKVALCVVLHSVFPKQV